jgi:uncharacterized membrane protein YjjP (DUF1212 family)
MQESAAKSGSAEEAAHISLELGRLLLINGADTAQVHNAVGRLADALGYQAHLIISYEAMLVTIDTNRTYHTRVGRHVPATIVNMTAAEMLNRIVDEAVSESLNSHRVHARLAVLEGDKPLYAPWMIALMLGLSAASLARLFGAHWFVFMVVYIAATIGTFVRQCLGRWHFNPFAISFLASLVSGVIGGVVSLRAMWQA